MQQYIARRLILGVFTGVLVSVIIFAILRIAPGDVALMIANANEGTEVNQQVLDKIREELGLNAPLHVQYLTWMKGIVTLHWGNSMYNQRSVWGEFVRKIPVTLELSIMSVLLSTLIGIPLGIIMALKQDTWMDYVIRLISLMGLSMPNFWTATLLLVGGVYLLDWSPRLGYVSLWEAPLDNLRQYVWPALILGFASSATKARMMRSTMLEVLRQDYIRTAHAKGLRNSVVVYRHAMKNALIPVVTIIGLAIAVILGGSVIIERIFSLPGIGNFLVEGMNYRDYPVVQSVVLFFAMWVVVANLVVDLSYGWLDPRIRYE